MRTHYVPGSTRSFSSTEAQNNFGQVLHRVQTEGPVFITRHNRPEAVILSLEEYEALTGPEPVDLVALEQEFDALFDRMQEADFERGTRQAFQLSAHELHAVTKEALAAEDHA